MNTRRRLLMSQVVQSTPVTTDNYVAGDIAFYDSTDDKIVLVHNEDINTDTYPASRYTPIGVVVIPNSHDVYGDGSCGVMSLMEMHCSVPTTGSTYSQSMQFGVFGTDISSLFNLNQVPIGNTENGIPTNQLTDGYLPSDGFHATQCLHDNDVFYQNNAGDMTVPSPYLTDGSRNPGYYQITSPLSTNNCLADFDGRGNTDKIITQRGNKDYTSWKPTKNAGDDYPSASCCDMFYTNGTQQGDWYLPAIGELGYLVLVGYKTNETIKNIRSTYGSSTGSTVSSNYSYSSSSEFDGENIIITSIADGHVAKRYKNSTNYTRAFIRIKPDGTITSRTTISWARKRDSPMTCTNSTHL